MSIGTTSIDCWRCGGPSGSVLPITISTRQCLCSALDVHHLRPLMTYSSPSRSIRVWMLVASLEATAGSVIANAERISPASSGRSQRSLCSSVPNCVSTSMLPVSGALQFIASGARCGERPMSSASGAYSALVRPGPHSGSGWKRFHRPRERASALSSSMIGGWKCGSPDSRICAS